MNEDYLQITDISAHRISFLAAVVLICRCCQNKSFPSKMTLSSIIALEENPSTTYLEITSLIIKILDDIIKYPYNNFHRHIRLDDDEISSKLLAGIGAMECLFELGFQEGDCTLVLPFNTSLDELIIHRNEIASRRTAYLSSRSLIRTSDNQQLYRGIGPVDMNPLMGQILYFYNFVLEYEKPDLLQAAKKCIPLSELEMAAERNMRKIQFQYKQGIKENVTISDLLLMELVSWFKNTFFTWVDSPKCSTCGGPTKFLMVSKQDGKERVELYECDHCNGLTTPFPRHQDPWKLLETRKGRCGEWASCFTLMCRSVGFDARLVYDVTDHLWTEVYCIDSEYPRWVHVDPCEGVIDAPLMYECGWGKKLRHILSFSVDGVQDVTWRYSQLSPQELLARRKQSGIPESELLAAILNLRQERYKAFTEAKKKYLIRRVAFELAEFLWTKEKNSLVKEEEKRGRISGSLAWRLERSELGNSSFQPYTWRLAESERGASTFTIKYSCATDKFFRIVGNKNTEILGWKSGLFESDAIFRKVERDWKMTYLAREEGSKEARMKLNFDVSASGLAIQSIAVLCKSAVYEDGQVTCILCGGGICLRVPTGENVGAFHTTALEGLETFTLEMKLSGGRGDCAWQHAQLFRQALDDSEHYPFEVNIKLKSRT
ncbi:peptide-N(4)-(N-acetyl-beta-glucosaminyl)asparagine amidase [Ischnura elegans]|uniref:peptide-N(4)-(N-acetyl-beta- glucosaminyl)asparagine amidase n=1 Tax=Ischnura elegans TaxID=197161 RepID=UPI001ED8691B|nr:peptide-N(4)-(N-acetyl-beta-glucosaminyl)asparagine amidase [Ischnura elegans]